MRIDPHIVLDRAARGGDSVVPFLERNREWDGSLVSGADTFVTAIGAGTTYPDYKPAPFIISSETEGVDMVTVVTEGIFSYCGVKLKIDTDRHLGPECSTVRAQGEAVGHVTTSKRFEKLMIKPTTRQPVLRGTESLFQFALFFLDESAAAEELEFLHVKNVTHFERLTLSKQKRSDEMIEGIEDFPPAREEQASRPPRVCSPFRVFTTKRNWMVRTLRNS